jgi:alpha-1,3-mannosyltransferase
MRFHGGHALRRSVHRRPGHDKLKILHVIRQFHPSIGGIESATLALCRRLQQREHDCDIVTLRRLWNETAPLPPSDCIDGMRIDRIPFVGGRRYFFAPEVLRFATTAAIIHIHAIDFFVDFLAATRWRHRTPLVVTTHGGMFHTTWAMAAKRVYFHTVTRLALTQAARVICNSGQDDRIFASIVPPAKRITIPNGVEDRFFDIRKSMDPGLLVMIGRIAEHKGTEKVIRLLPEICRAVDDARLVIVGPDWDGRRAGLEALAASLGIARRVSFTGPVPADVLSDYLTRAHLVLTASAYEGFGIAVLEAMASGSAVVASNIDAHRELIRPGVDGLLVDFEDRGGAGEAIVAALRRPASQLLEMGAAARASASRFRWDAVAEQVEAVYRQTVSGARRDCP